MDLTLFLFGEEIITLRIAATKLDEEDEGTINSQVELAGEAPSKPNAEGLGFSGVQVSGRSTVR